MNTNAIAEAVVPGYYLVCYNYPVVPVLSVGAVVPGYYLVCYNDAEAEGCFDYAVVPGYYLVCYNFYYVCSSPEWL